MPNESVFNLKLKSQLDNPKNPAYDLEEILARRTEGTDFKNKATVDNGAAVGRRLGIIDQSTEQQNRFTDERVAVDLRTKNETAFAVGQQKYQAALDNQNASWDANQKAAISISPTGTVNNNSSPVGRTNDGSLRSKLVSGASAYEGTPYVWGGANTKGFDCSGLIQYVYKSMGITMPRVSQQQAKMGRQTTIDQLKPGDFVAWGSSPGTATHIAIYAGNGKVWEAAKRGTNVRTRAINANEKGIMGIALSI